MVAGLFLNVVLEVPASPLLRGILLTLFLGPVSFMMLVLLFGFDVMVMLFFLKFYSWVLVFFFQDFNVYCLIPAF